MSKTTINLTHKGWFGMCPVYFSDPFGEAPMVEPRHWLLTPLMMASELAYSVMFTFARMARQDYEAAWPLKITGKLATPIALQVPVE